MSSISTNRFILFLLTTVFTFCIGVTNAQQKPRNNIKSAVTGQKFKQKRKKAQAKATINYINSIKGTLGIGVANYAGDLCKGFGCTRPRPSIVAGLQYRIDESLSLRTEFTWVRLAGTDAGGIYDYRNLSFRADNFEFTGAIQYDFFNYEKLYRRRRFIAPYVFVGLGFTTVNPTAEYEGRWHALRPLQTEGRAYGSVAMVIPYGAGVRFKVSPALNVGVEAGVRWVFSDYLDDVSSKYDPTISKANGDTDIRIALADRREEYLRNNVFKNDGVITELEKGQLHGEQSELFHHVYNDSDRGKPDSNDGYMLIQVKAEYTLKVTKQHYNINSNVNRFRLFK